MKKHDMRKLVLPWLLIIFLVLVGAGGVSGETVANMRGYCNVPALAGFGVKPNLLLLLDNSASMYDLAYTDSSKYCLDDSADTYSASRDQYLGYFNPDSFYQYVSRTDPGSGNEIGYFEPAGASMPPGHCNRVSNQYLCVNINAQGKVSKFAASGNFLNWLAMSKLDIEKMALTGGKFDTATMMLQGETRGCQGKRFIKMVGDAGVTFAVRGPVPAEGDYNYQASQGGMTRIEIYAKRYNKDACLAAVKAWQNGNAVDLKTQSALCMNEPYEPDGQTPSKGKVYTEIMSACYSYLAGEAGAIDSVFPDLMLDCQTRIMYVYNDQPELITKNEGDLICGKSVYHRITNHEGYDWSHGYFGAEYLPGGMGFPDQGILTWHAQDYCSELTNPSLTDPSTVALKSGTSANVPSFVLEAGLYDLGEVAGTMVGRVHLPTAPVGVIQQFKDDINFGAMVFNNGVGSECSSSGEILCPRHCTEEPPPQKQCYQDSDCMVGSCNPDRSADGGTVISHVNHSPVGDHTRDSGLIAAIDQIRGDAWTPLSEAFYNAIGYYANRADLRLSATDFDSARPPSKFSCQKNDVLIVSDGMSTADRAQPVLDLVAKAVSDWVNVDRTMPPSQTTTDKGAASPTYSGSYNLDDLAWIARNKNISSFQSPIISDRDYISTFVIYTGVPCADRNADGTCATSDEGVPEKMMQLTAAKGGGKMFSAQKPGDLVTALRSLLQLVGTGANSTTDASFLATGQGNGALFIQEQFYRNKSFDGGATSAAWIGEMQGLWYFIDPFIGSTGGASAIREDTGGLKVLDLKRDRVVRYFYDSDQGQTFARLYLDTNGDGNADPSQPTGYPLDVAPEAVQSLWRAGPQLWEKNPATRTIYTHTDGKNLIGLTSNGTSLAVLDLSRPVNQKLLQAESKAEAEGIASFAQGYDAPETRSRLVKIDPAKDARVWKLGDVISSTPVLQSPVSLGNYHLPSPKGYGDRSYGMFIDPKGAYGRRGTAYLGANDGMLHAFNLGILQQHPQGAESWPETQKAVLTGKGIGEESWAFIPKNALPYLRYLKEPLYPHLYYVDGASTIVDVSIGDPDNCSPSGSYWNCLKDANAGTNWRTVLIGAMGLGGASRNAGDDSCAEGKTGTCVKAPEAGGGLSSYFALDVTGQTSEGGQPPRLLWEFSHPELGYATSGAAIMKVNALGAGPSPRDDTEKNGRWFAVFASGPTGPIDPENCQFLGVSDQKLKLFVVDINASPPLVKGGNYWVIETGIDKAFGGSMYRAGIDADKWDQSSQGFYEDDALYLGYTRLKIDGRLTGGVLRLLTKGNLDPGTWRVSRVIDGIGPVTGAVAKLQDRKNHQLWLYFGTGRFFHNQDDLTGTRALFGVKEACYTSNDALDAECGATPLLLSDLTDMTDTAEPASSSKGWWIGLDRDGGGFGSERLSTNPAVLSSGAVYFTTFKPATDICRQGISYLWGVQYDTGGSIVAPVMGTAIVPLSNASSAEFPIADLSERGKRRSAGMPGKPGGVKLISNSGLKPLKKIIHIQER